MDNIIELIRQGCELAKELELNLHENMANLQRDSLINSCDDILKVFTQIRSSLASTDDTIDNTGPLDLGPYAYRPQHTHEGPGSSSESRPLKFRGGSYEELLRSIGCAQPISHSTLLLGMSSGVKGPTTEVERQEVVGRQQPAVVPAEMTRRSPREGPTRIGGSGGQGVHLIDVSDPPRAPTVVRTRRRNDGEKRTIRVPAPRMGNTEIPPEDGYTWRKYGQKEILGSRFPRGYYRCTHQKLCQCPAKKQVQRLDEDPFTFEVTYRYEHTCHMSSTAPSVPPPPPPSSQPPSLEMAIVNPMMPPPAVPPPRWMLDFDLGGGASGSRNVLTGGRGSRVRSIHDEAGPSNAEYPFVSDMVDVMFNSGSSSTNSMDFIFPSNAEDKWDQEGDNKKD